LLTGQVAQGIATTFATERMQDASARFEVAPRSVE